MAESPIRKRGPIAEADALEVLRTGEVTLLGRLPWSSNATFLVDVSPAAGSTGDVAPNPAGDSTVDATADSTDGPADGTADDPVAKPTPSPVGASAARSTRSSADGPMEDPAGGQVGGQTDGAASHPADDRAAGAVAERPTGEPVVQAVYKPVRGERPLHDFPPGLHRREVAAYELSAALGWGLVPPTVLRDGPLGLGSLQLFVLADFEQHYFTLRERADLLPALRRLCAFDVVANATDRKGGHVLLEGAEQVWAIDNGLCFHAAFKLRTVIWDFAGEPLPDDVRHGLRRLCGGDLAGGELAGSEVAGSDTLGALGDLLDPTECAAVAARAETLLAAGTFPTDPTGRRWPWPVV